MQIIGERLNTTRERVLRAVEEKDAKYLQVDAQKQVEAGAHFIDVNAAVMMEKESEYLEWMVKIIQDILNIPMALDSPNPLAIERALKVHRGQALINSVSLELEPYNSIIDLIVEHDCLVVGLCLDENGMPSSVDERVENAYKLVEKLTTDKVKSGNIFLDPLATSLSVDPNAGKKTIETIRRIKKYIPDVHVTLGLSNVSFGLPKRHALNRVFLSMCMAMGMDSAIMDPLDGELMSTLVTCNALLGEDEFCLQFIEATRAGKID